MGPFTYEFMQ